MILNDLASVDAITTPEGFGTLPKEQFEAEYLRLIKEDLDRAIKNLDALPKSQCRGLTLETYRHFHCGYLSDWLLTKSRAEFNCGLYVNNEGRPKRLPPPSERIIIPTPAMNHFNAVATSSARQKMNSAFWKQHAGVKELFGDPAALDADLIFVTEGELDTMSIYQCSQGSLAALSILGCGNWKKTLLPKLENLRGKKLILLFDKDDAGEKAVETFYNELLAHGCLAVKRFIYDELLKEPFKKKLNRADFNEKVDCNEVLDRRGDEYLKKILEQIIESAEPEFQKIKPEIEKELRYMDEYATFKEANPEMNVHSKQSYQKPIGDLSKESDSDVVEEIKRILRDFVHARDLTRKEWVSVGMILKRYGFSLEDFQQWSNDGDARYSAARCTEQWNSFKSADELQGGGLKIGTLVDLAKKYGGDKYKPLSRSERRIIRFKEDNPEIAAEIISNTAAQTAQEALQTAPDTSGTQNNNPKPAQGGLSNSDSNSATNDEDINFQLEIAALNAELKATKEKIKQADAEEAAAVDALKEVTAYDSDIVFTDNVVYGAACARIYDKKLFSDFKRELKAYSDKHKETRVSVNDWLALVKDKERSIKDEREALQTKINQINAKIDTLKFKRSNRDILEDFSIPEGYSLSNSGVKNVAGASISLVCPQPLIATRKVIDTESDVQKMILTVKENGKWRSLPATEAAIIFNRTKLVDLANAGLAVTSTNAGAIVDWLLAFTVENQRILPVTKITRGGWQQFGNEKVFVDPRLKVEDEEGRPVEAPKSILTRCLKQSGDFEDWRKVYKTFIKKIPVANFLVAAAVSVPLLDVLGERNFTVYLMGDTRAGKTTALLFAASAVGSDKIVRNFDATKNGLVGLAAEHNDYPLFIDEKQQADSKLAEKLSDLIYVIGNGVGRTRLNRNSELMDVAEWRTIGITTGETPLIEDNATGGAFTRSLTIATKGEILSEADCRIIRRVAQKSFGLIYPKVIEKIKAIGVKELEEHYDCFNIALIERNNEILSDHRRYLSTVAVGNMLLNSVIDSADDLLAYVEDTEQMIYAIADNNIQTKHEIADSTRAVDFITGIIAQNAINFIKGSNDVVKPPIFGKLSDRPGDYSYFIQEAFNDVCRKSGRNPAKVAKDLAVAKFFIPNDTIEKDHKSPRLTVLRKINNVATRCYRIPNELLQGISTDS